MKTQQERFEILKDVFSPSAPITSRELFLGRSEQIDEVLGAVSERGQHIVLYGERGVGKTSLANILHFGLPGVFVVKVTCNRTEGFKEVWEKAFQKVRFVTATEGIGFQPEKKVATVQLDLFLPDKEEINSLDIQNVLERVSVPLLFIFDEFDSIQDPAAKTRFADTIKALSDNAPCVTILIVGIADSINHLIGEHRSIERCLKQVQMPRMSDLELEGIINKGLELLAMSIDSWVKDQIVRFSVGFPHFTHLLAKYAAKAAIANDTTEITRGHFAVATTESLTNAHESIRNAYQKATIASKKSSKFEDVLSAAATAEEDEHRTFSTNDILVAYRRLTGKKASRQSLVYNIGKLCAEERGSILEVIGKSKNIKFRFRNPLIKAFTRLKLFERSMAREANKTSDLPILQ